MLQFLGKSINSKYDLLVVKMKAFDFIRSLKFEKTDAEKLQNFIFELANELIFNQTDAYIYLNYYRQERKKGLEIYVYNKSITIERTQQILSNNFVMANRSIFFDKSYFDSFELRQDPKLGAEVHIIKLLK